MGVQALRSHASGKKHKNLTDKITHFFSKAGKHSTTVNGSAESSSSTSTNKQHTMKLSIVSSEKTVAEIRWAVHSVAKGHSNNSNDNISALFKSMFSDSDIANEFLMGLRHTFIKYSKKKYLLAIVM